MKSLPLVDCIYLLLVCSFPIKSQDVKSFAFNIPGIKSSVEIITDHWGVPHIYAENEDDLFFAQGWNAAKDRLFQFEIWRRQATGTVAEILGMDELNRDIGGRLFRFRGDMRTELNMYHGRGEAIINSYVRGINAYIDMTLADKSLLPIEFRLLGIEPQHWTAEVVVSRHQGLLGNIREELDNALAIAATDTATLSSLLWFHPQRPVLSMDPKIRQELLHSGILDVYEAFRRPIVFRPYHIVSAHRNNDTDAGEWAVVEQKEYNDWYKENIDHIGSNNWVINGSLTESGFPIMANDPHRALSSPSLRYIAHLQAPGWNVIGGGEPTIPGISIGHNEHGAWGLTIYSTDAEDLYVYELNPDNPRQYRYQDSWEDMILIPDTIIVKDVGDIYVTHHYTRHGPVTLMDSAHHVAYAVRCGWLEPGSAPYLASLRMDQSRNWSEFRLACRNSFIPGENMIWADRYGDIGWQAVGIAPIRNNWSGLVPVPGDGHYEWDGYMPNLSRPHLHNPANGFINTSNENVTPPDYEYWNATGYRWSDPYRGNRVKEVLRSSTAHSMTDMMALQTDYLSISARQILPLFKHLETQDLRLNTLLSFLEDWDYHMSPSSIAAGIYHQLETVLRERVSQLMIPDQIKPYIYIQNFKLIEWLYTPPAQLFGDKPENKTVFLLEALKEADTRLIKKISSDTNKWQYGQSAYKHALVKHPLSSAVNKNLQQKLDVGPLPRGGNANTVNNTANSDNQRSGATFKIIVDTYDWDKTMAMNSPGQNGNPDHPHYANLFSMWAKDQYFPLLFSKEKVEKAAAYKTYLIPR